MNSKSPFIHETAYVDKNVSLSSGCIIEANARILGDVKLSKNVWIGFNSIVYGPVEIGNETYIGPNCIVGFPQKNELNEIIKQKSFEQKIFHGSKTVIGNECILRSNCTIYSGVEIGNRVKLGHNVLIRENVVINDDSLIGTNVIIDGNCRIGRKVSIQTGAYVCAYSIIEDFVFIGPNCVLLNDKYSMQKKTKLIGPLVKKGASLGGNSTIMAGVVIEEGAIVGSEAMVTKNVEAKSIYVGIPAKKVKKVPKKWHSLLENE
jgi:acetyltransferase-like isoleucine patch superfamily enzyme